MILTLIEVQNQQIKKSSLESLSLAFQISEINKKRICAVVVGAENSPLELGAYGADELVMIPNVNLENDQITGLLYNIAKDIGAGQIVMSLNSVGKNSASVLAAKLNAALISGVVSVFSNGSDVVYSKNVFSGKASVKYTSKSEITVVAVMPNAINVQSDKNKVAAVNNNKYEIPSSRLKTLEKKMVKGKTPLTEASIVVSAGRGLKDPANWNMIEELADQLGASTACSRPVADVGWRPHHEHVGQTGIAIRPNVYIAIGISGAIQHLAGVNNSRKIIVINKDPEAPFFKAADYGICGDLFEIIPKLNEAIKKYKSNA